MSKDYLLDLGERAVRTFAQGFVSVVTVDALTDDINTSLLTDLKVGGLAGVFAIVTALAAKRVGHPDSASFLEEKS